MKISTFRARDMREALQEVKDALGPDAVILSTRRVRERSKNGLPLSRTMIEVTACPNPLTSGEGKEEGERLSSGYGGESPPELSRGAGRYGNGKGYEPEPVSEAPRGAGRYGSGKGYEPEPVPEAPRGAGRYGSGKGYEPEPVPEAPRGAGRYGSGKGYEPDPIPEAPRNAGRYGGKGGVSYEDERHLEPDFSFPDRYGGGNSGGKGAPSVEERIEPPSFRSAAIRAGRFAQGVDEPVVPPGGHLAVGGEGKIRERGALDYPASPPGGPAKLYPEPHEPAGVSATDLSTIRSTLASLEERVSSLPEVLAREMHKIPDVPGLDTDGKRIYGWLLMHGVEEIIARKLAMVEQAAKEKGLEMALKRFLKFRDPLDGNSRVISLVGPTGVGKTTTLAKIAAELLLNRRRSVGMITLDTFRVGAVAQLETYARLLQVRLVVARNPSEVKAGMSSLNRCDSILVDTVGSSPYNRRQVDSTGELLPALGESREVLLCMAGNVRETEQKAIFRRFYALGPTGLIFTKLDETVTYGGILNVALRARLPLTLYTDGQRVPENLGWLTTEVMANWFLQGQEQFKLESQEGL